MALYSYVKFRSFWKKKAIRIISLIFIIVGLTVLLFVLYPIVSFELFFTPQYSGLVSPVPSDLFRNTIADALPQALGLGEKDYTRASAWFPKSSPLKIDYTISSYTLDIPKLGINEAKVIVGGDDLAKSLIQYTGVLPGNPGNPVIFGHSTLIYFYNPKSYKAIFSKLPTLKNGDEIITNVDKITYKYQVFEMKVVQPDDLSVLEQRSDDSYITLITCVPPGTYLRRLIVRGKLVKI